MNPQEYLSERVSKILINSDKFQNEGARLLAHSADWESNLDTYINEAWDSLDVCLCLSITPQLFTLMFLY